MIVLFGATGYTGQLIASELEHSNLDFKIAGRSKEKLANLSYKLNTKPEWRVADPAQPKSLRKLIPDCNLIINCVGPFTDLGEPVVALAAQHGIHYLDITNELGFVHKAQSYDALAKHNNCVIVPACGFEIAISDCIARMMAKSPKIQLDRVDVFYALSGGGSSMGTRKSAIRTLSTSWLGYANGKWKRQLPGIHITEKNTPLGMRTFLSIPSSEIIGFTKHLDVNSIQCWMAISQKSKNWARLAVPAFSILGSLPLGIGKSLADISKYISPPHPENIRTNKPYSVSVVGISDQGKKEFSVSGFGPYEATAKIIAYAAKEITGQGFKKRGFLTPSMAFDAERFLVHAEKNWGIAIQI